MVRVTKHFYSECSYVQTNPNTPIEILPAIVTAI